VGGSRVGLSGDRLELIEGAPVRWCWLVVMVGRQRVCFQIQTRPAKVKHETVKLNQQNKEKNKVKTKIK
jgi:hypothetical protein